MAEEDRLDKAQAQYGVAAAVVVQAAAGTVLVGWSGLVDAAEELLVVGKKREKIHQVLVVQGWLLDLQRFLFFSVFPDEPPLVEVGRLRLESFQGLAGEPVAESLAQQVGIDDGTGAADTEPAVDQHFLAEIETLVEPVEGLFQFRQVGGFLVGDGQIVDLEAGFFLDPVQVAEFRAEVEYGADPQGADSVEGIVGHGGLTDGEIVGDPVDPVVSVFHGDHSRIRAIRR